MKSPLPAYHTNLEVEIANTETELDNDKTYKKVKDAQTEVKSADAYVLMYQQMVTVKKGGMYRRQTISLPHLWPHMVGVEESAGRSSIFRPSELKLKKAMSDPSVG